jgi:hypothetical protein
MTEFRNVGALTDLADGSILAPGEAKELDAEAQADPYNARLIEEGRIVDTTAVIEEEPKATTKKGGDK